MASRSFQLIHNVDTASKIKHRVDELQIIYVFPTKKMPPNLKVVGRTGLEINARKLAKCEWFW